MHSRALLTAVFALYCITIAFGAFVHEPWWDEAQAWLLARDAAVADLFLRHAAYEGHPPLWHLLLAIPAKLGLPYASLKVVAALIAAAGVYVLLFHLRQVPLVIRVLAPFSFYLAYQYTVVARSYVLIGATLLAIAAIYERRAQRFGTFVLLLAVLSGASVHGFAMAIALAMLFVLDAVRGRVSIAEIPRGRGLAAVAALLLWWTALIVILWPASDLTSQSDLGSPLDPRRYVQVILWLVPELFWGDESHVATAVSVVAMAVVLYWLSRRGFALVFALLAAAVLGVSAMYFSAWHEGLFFFVLFFSIAVAFGREGRDRVLTRVVIALVIVLLLRHAQWTAISLRYDARNEFTGSARAAAFIRERGIDRARVFGMGVRAMELQPYFGRNLYANARTTFWDWSAANEWPYPRRTPESSRSMRDWYIAQMARQPEYVVCAIGFRNDHNYALALARNPAYRLLGTFQGRVFRKTEPDELIAFQIFRRVSTATTARTTSAAPATHAPTTSERGR